MTSFDHYLKREHNLTTRQFLALSVAKRVEIHEDWMKRGRELEPLHTFWRRYRWVVLAAVALLVTSQIWR